MSGCKARETTRLLDRACPRRLPNREVAVSLYSVGKNAMLTWRQSGSAYADVVQGISRQLFEVRRDRKAAGASRVTRALEIGREVFEPLIWTLKLAMAGDNMLSHSFTSRETRSFHCLACYSEGTDAHFFDLFFIGANFVQRAAVVNLQASLRKTCSLRDQSVAPPDKRTHSPVT